MNLKDDQLSEISRLSALLISPADIAIYLELEEQDFLLEVSDKKSEIHKHFRKGYLKTLIKKREILFPEDENGEIAVSPENTMEIQRLLEEYEAIIQSNINNV